MQNNLNDERDVEFEDAEFDEVYHAIPYSTLMAITIVLGVALIAVITLFIIYYKNTSASIRQVAVEDDAGAGIPLDVFVPDETSEVDGAGDDAVPPADISIITTPRIDHVKAFSSNESTSYGNYDPRMMLDGDPETAWNARWEDDVDAWLKIYLREEAQVAEISLIPGYAKLSHPKFGNIFRMNHRIKDVEIEFPSGRTLKHRFSDSSRLQAVQVDPPELCTDFTIHIRSIYKGEKWTDICISELEIAGK